MQTHGEKTVVLLPQCPVKSDWKQLRRSLDELTRQKAREFRVHPNHISELGSAALSEEECAGLFERVNAQLTP